jgi:hypothetical protein
MDIEESINYSNYLEKMILNSLIYYNYHGQLKNLVQIRKTYGNHINNINMMIKLGLHIFLINCNNDNKIDSFYNECNYIKNKLSNKNLIFHNIYISKLPIYYNNIINIHLNNIINTEMIQLDILLHKLYYYIADTTNIYPGLKSLDSQDVIMTIRYN